MVGDRELICERQREGIFSASPHHSAQEARESEIHL
jgi:hypothetical protein